MSTWFMNIPFSQYIMGLVEESDCCWYRNPNESAPWEEKVSLLVGFISNSAVKLDLILKALNQAPAPWSPGIKNLAKMGQNLDDPRTFLVQEQENLVVVKQIVAKYQAGNYYRRRGREAERLLQVRIIFWSILGPLRVYFRSNFGPFLVHFRSGFGPFQVHFKSISGPF